MNLIIDSINIKNVCCPPQINKTHRSESVDIALDGNTIVDRIGIHKFVIIVEIPFIEGSLWHRLVASLEKIKFNVQFDFNSASLTRVFRCGSDISSPICFIKGGKTYYRDISLSLEEM
jgi:hypothetical protein